VTGKTFGGNIIPLNEEPDIAPLANHSPKTQSTCMNGGLMNGCSRIRGCNKAHGYRCYTAVEPNAIPNITALAGAFAVSDKTFELNLSSSWGGHTEMLAGTLDGFEGVNPKTGTSGKSGPGWGCDSKKDAPWHATPGDPFVNVPSCIPDQSGAGPYRPSPVAYVPTILDRLDSKSLSWNLYAGKPGDPPGAGYARAMCPTFYECLGSEQHTHVKEPSTFAGDASGGALPNFSIVVPYRDDSMHGGYSLTAGDNWIAQQIGAVENGPDWNSTAVFITWDDCGCYYDHVNPWAYDPSHNWGVRLPMIIVSPLAKPRFTDSTPATFASILAFTEHVFGLSPLGQSDATAYDYMKSFNFNQTPVQPIHLVQHSISRKELRHIASHPPPNSSS
jgi:Phosphoesterase family